MTTSEEMSWMIPRAIRAECACEAGRAGLGYRTTSEAQARLYRSPWAASQPLTSVPNPDSALKSVREASFISRRRGWPTPTCTTATCCARLELPTSAKQIALRANVRYLTPNTAHWTILHGTIGIQSDLSCCAPAALDRVKERQAPLLWWSTRVRNALQCTSIG
jgi:hypothetical protein